MARKHGTQQQEQHFQNILRIFLHDYKSASLTINGLYPDIVELVGLTPQADRQEREAEQVLHAISIAHDRITLMTMLMEIMAEQDALTLAEHFSPDRAIEMAIESVRQITSVPLLFQPSAASERRMIFGKESFFMCACSVILRLFADPDRTRMLYTQTMLDGALLEVHIIAAGKALLPEKALLFQEIARQELAPSLPGDWVQHLSGRDELWFALTTKAIQLLHGSVYFKSVAELHDLAEARMLALPAELLVQPGTYTRFILPTLATD